MSTTVLFVELLIIGMQTSAWLILLLLTIFGISWIKLLVISGWENIILLIFLAFSYVLGIMIDRLADALFDPWDKHLKKRYFSDSQIHVGVIRFDIAKDNDYLNRQFEYTRSRIRIVRATSINITLLTITGIITIIIHGINLADNIKWGLIIVLVVLGVILVVLSLFSFEKLMYTYLTMVKRNYDKVLSEKDSSQPNCEESAAS